MWSTTGLNITTIAFPYLGLHRCYCQYLRFITTDFFADGTNLFTLHKDLKALVVISVNREVKLLYTYLKLINSHWMYSKTVFMVFTRAGKIYDANVVDKRILSNPCNKFLLKNISGCTSANI